MRRPNIKVFREIIDNNICSKLSFKNCSLDRSEQADGISFAFHMKLSRYSPMWNSIRFGAASSMLAKMECASVLILQ